MLLASAELSAQSVGSDVLPLVVLHGLYGSSRNWRSVGRSMGEERRVIALDLPNHGSSPRSTDCSYGAQAAAVGSTLEALEIERCVLMGHSMGGKVAMALTHLCPQRLEKLLVLDIGPWPNHPERELLDAMRALPLAEVASRSEAEQWLAGAVPDRPTLLFLLTNLVRRSPASADGAAFEWQLGLDELASGFSDIGAAPLPAGTQVGGPVAFLAGGASDYLRTSDLESLRSTFPEASLEVLAGVGHNVHVEGGARFLSWVEQQISSSN